MLIRPYSPGDSDAVRAICLATCSDPYLLAHTDVLWAKYADYYITEEPEHCLVAQAPDGRVVGYLLCSADPGLYQRSFDKLYRKALADKGLKQRFLQRFTEHEIRRMARRGYPAHLHIDILPEAQRQGLGHRMVDALLHLLAAEGVPGVYLGCAASNKIGNAFYRKAGFRLLGRVPGCNLYGIKVNEKEI